MQDWKDYLLHVGLSCILFNCQILVAKINVMLCYRDIVVCTAYVNLNLDVNTIFSALDRTNRQFYKRQSLFIYMPPQRTRPRCSTMDSCSESFLLLQRHSSTNETPSSNIIRGRCVLLIQNTRQKVSSGHLPRYRRV